MVSELRMTKETLLYRVVVVICYLIYLVCLTRVSSSDVILMTVSSISSLTAGVFLTLISVSERGDQDD